MREPAASGPEDGDRRIVRGDEWRPAGTRGGPGGPGGVLYAYIAIAAFMLSIDTVDILTILHDAARSGLRIRAWEPTIWEYTSGAASIAFAGLAWLALRLAPPERGRWLRFAGVHALAASAYSVLHIAGMVGARTAIYAILGLPYHWALGDFTYEYRKDLPGYVLMASIFWVAGRLTQRPTPAASTGSAITAFDVATFDIVDGARTWRTPVGEIVAVQSAGNYVEFRLADGAVRMMRATLAEVEQGLGAHGFVRVHRSWVVNAHRLRLLEPSGSGDYRLVLDGGVEAPVSRRYPAALARLKGTAPADG